MDSDILDSSATPVRRDRLTTRNQAEALQFDYWKAQIAPILDVERPVSADLAASPSRFLVDAVGYDLGKFHFAAAHIDAQSYRHGEHHIRTSALDHWVFEYCKKGLSVSQAGERSLQCPAGSLSLKSLAYPYAGSASETSSLYLFISRETFPNLADRLDAANHTLIHGGVATFLKEFIVSLENYLPTITVDGIAEVNDALLALVRAYGAQVPHSVTEAPEFRGIHYEMARKFIQANLRSPRLSPDTIAEALGISRRKLFYLFEREGGIANYIKRQRLAACHDAIVNDTADKPIYMIARAYGMPNPALFSRQFRNEYGYSPSEAREARLTSLP